MIQKAENQETAVQFMYDAALIVTAIALPFSNFLMSQGAFLLVMAWAVDRWKLGPIFRGRTWGFWRAQSVMWGVLALFAWNLISLGWTDELTYGLRALRIQLPLLAFPLVLSTGRWNPARSLPAVRIAMAISVGAACLACLWMGSQAEGELRLRDWSPFISHIRFSLMITFIWGWWLSQALDQQGQSARTAWMITVILGLLGAAFTWKSASLTAVFLFPVVGLLAVWLSGRWRKGISGIAAGLIAVGLGIGWTLRPVYPDASTLPESTSAGAPYQHFPDRCLRENGSHVWTHIAWEELEQGWRMRSARDLDGLDDRQQELRMTLIRFLTSKGLRKDAEGVAQLTAQDIQWIESGIPTVLEKEHTGLLRRRDIVQFEIWNAIDGGNPSGHSLMQRWAFLRTGMHIYQHHPVIGVGIGDVPAAFQWAYDDLQSPLEPPFRLRAHNQYLTFLIAAGPLGFVIWLVILYAVLPAATRKNADGRTAECRRAAVLCVAVLALSCLTEDTLETQAGVTFAGFFVGLFGRRFP